MARAIACGHCGGTHGSVAEVRACALDHPAETPTTPTPAATPPAAMATPAPVQAAADVGLDAAIERLAGPDRLGRSVVLEPGADVPEPWRDAEVVAASAEAEPGVIDRLLSAWRERERVAIEWSGPWLAADPVLDIAFHRLTPATDLPGEQLRFAVTANAVNLLDGNRTFEPISLAVAAGAQQSQTDGDVELADGSVVWADGGPLDVLAPGDLGGLAVVPRPNLVTGQATAQRVEPSAPTADLAPDQLAAVAHRGGPARIIAPAGSGKTRVLTERTRHLVNDRGLNPSAVSLVAYNRRARQEMAERLTDVASLDIRTLNSLALAIATGTGSFATRNGSRRLTTISEIDARRLLDDIVPGRRRRQLTDPLEPWIDALSACRLGLRDPDEVEAAYGADIAGFADVLDRYRKALRSRGELDFDEQILTAIEVLLTDPAARLVARRATPLLLIDEFQDLTPAHLLLIRLLSGPAAEVFAVGDDDQTIYGYSGASPDWLVHFSRYFTGAEDHPLTVNYRCPAAVVTAATKLLSHNRNRVSKEIKPGPGAASPDDRLLVNTTDDVNTAVVTRVGELIADGVEPSDIAVLARVNAALVPPLLYLADAGHPVARPPGVDGRMLERSGVAAALSWLRLATAPEQRLRADDLRLALRRPPRSLHPRIVDWVCEQRSVKHLLALSERLNREREANTVAELAADIERLRRLAEGEASTVELLDHIFDDIGLLGAASQLDQSQRTARRAAHADELAALRALAAIAPSGAELEPWIREHLDSIPRLDDADRGPVITIATIHSTKGLEWPHVIVHDVRGDLHPHRLATDIEEERRIFHVAVTRCAESVLVNAGPPGAAPRSPFLVELDAARPADEPWPEQAPATSLLRPSPAGPKKKPKRSDPSGPEAAARRQALTEWRTQRSKADDVPAYVVLDNATLDAIAEKAPASLIALGRIKGIGPTKLDRYGADILGVISE